MFEYDMLLHAPRLELIYSLLFSHLLTFTLYYSWTRICDIAKTTQIYALYHNDDDLDKVYPMLSHEPGEESVKCSLSF